MNQETAFENWLEDVNKMMSFFAESLLKALLDLFEGVVEVCPNKCICSTTDDSNEETVTALADEGAAAFWKIKAFLEVAVGIL